MTNRKEINKERKEIKEKLQNGEKASLYDCAMLGSKKSMDEWVRKAEAGEIVRIM